jgi:regulator of RNase E activity RraB
MHLPLPFLLWVGVVAMAQAPIDPQRVEAELAADADVLRSLNENGDVPTVVRPVDVRFIGSARTVGALEKQIGTLGWRVVQRVPLDDGTEALDVQRDQTTDHAAIRQLTEAALQIEAQYGVRYDGWGTVATTP